MGKWIDAEPIVRALKECPTRSISKYTLLRMLEEAPEVFNRDKVVQDLRELADIYSTNVLDTIKRGGRDGK